MEVGYKLLCVNSGNGISGGEFTKNRVYDVNIVDLTSTPTLYSFRIIDDDGHSVKFDDIDVNQSVEVIRKYPKLTFFMDVTDMSEEDLFTFILSN